MNGSIETLSTLNPSLALDPIEAMHDHQWNPERLQSATQYAGSCILITAAHLNLFGFIGTRAKTVLDTAAHFSGSPAGWEIFLNALCGMGLLRKHGSRYKNTRFALGHLSNGAETPLLAAYDAWQVWGELALRLIGGKRPPSQEPFTADRKKAERLLRGLHFHAEQIAPYLSKKLFLGRCQTLLDVGGGLGTFSLALCRRYPRLHATIAEHPFMLSLVRRTVKNAGLADRIRVVGVDFTRDLLPQGFDVVLVSNVLHAHGADQNRSLLRKLYRSLNPRGQLILRDVFMNRKRIAPEWGAHFSVLLFLHTPQGRCYALAEVLKWLRQAGFVPFRGPFRSSPLRFDPDAVLIAKKP